MPRNWAKPGHAGIRWYSLFKKLTLWMLREETGLWQHHQNCSPSSVLWIFDPLLLSPAAVKPVARAVYGLGRLYHFVLFVCCKWRAWAATTGCPAGPHSCSGHPAGPQSLSGRPVGLEGPCLFFSCALLPFVLGRDTVTTAYPATVCCIESSTFPLMWFL